MTNIDIRTWINGGSTYTYTILQETDKAYHIQVNAKLSAWTPERSQLDKAIWLPKRGLTLERPAEKNGGVPEYSIKAWLCKKLNTYQLLALGRMI